MDFSEYGDWAIALVNTRAGDENDDPLQSLEGLKTFLLELTHGGGRAQENDLPLLREVRDQLGAVIEAPMPEDAADRLNVLLARCDFRPHLVYSVEQGWHLHAASDTAPIWRWMAAVCGLGLVSLLMDHGAHTLGACARPGCRRVFLDRSRAGNRQFCSITCANRAHVSAFRERQRTLSHNAG